MQRRLIRNVTRGTVVAAKAELADSFFRRALGLMGRKSLPKDGGLILVPNNNIHMFFMRFPIDVIFVNRELEVVKLQEDFRPWAPFAAARKAHYTLELPVGTITASQTQVGDTLALEL